jgi:hypothetical protein
LNISTLLRATLPTLEAIYAEPTEPDVPDGLFRGRYLCACDSAGARRLANRVMVRSGFRLLPFGVDFDRRAWWFGAPLAKVGRFDPSPGRSRWRPADVIRLDYHPSRLPAPVRGVLYDEVKPLARGICLGLGGLNRDRGEGDLFFFALYRDKTTSRPAATRRADLRSSWVMARGAGA